MWPAYDRTYLLVKNLRTAECRGLEDVLRAQPGVLDVDVSLQASRAAVTSRPQSVDLERLVRDCADHGCEVVPLIDREKLDMQRNQEHHFVQLVVALAFGMQVLHMWMLLMPRYMRGEFATPNVRFLEWWSLGLATLVFFYGGWSFLGGSWRAVRDRRMSWDYLFALVGLVLYVYSVVAIFTGGWTFFGPLAVLVILVTFGEFGRRYLLRPSHEDDTQREADVEQ